MSKTTHKISNRFVKTIAIMMVLFLTATSLGTYILGNIRNKATINNNLYLNNENKLDEIGLKIKHIIDNIKGFSESSVVINSLIDADGRSSYLPDVLREFTRKKEVLSIVVFNYFGEAVESSSDLTSLSWYNPMVFKNALTLGKYTIQFIEETGSILIISPINYYSTTQGGIAVEVDLKHIFITTVSNPNGIGYNLSIGQDWHTDFNIPDGQHYETSITADNGHPLASLQAVMHATISNTIANKGLKTWLVESATIGIIGIIISLLVAQRVGRNLANPIIKLTEKVQDEIHPAGPVGTGDELELLATTIDDKTEKLLAEKNKLETRVKERTKELKHRETYLRAIFDNAGEAIITTSNDGTILTANKATSQILGYNIHTLVGKNISSLIPSVDKIKVPEEPDATGMLFNSGDKDIMGLHYNGNKTPLDLQLSSFPIDNQEIYLYLLRDNTEKNKMLRIKDEFISVVSHELRTPLTSIKGSLGLLEGGALGPLQDNIKDLVSVAKNNSDRLLTLVNDILNIQKMESNNIEYDCKKLDAGKLIEDCISVNRGLEKNYNITFSITEKTPDLYIYADKDRTFQILTNLMSNAAKFSPSKERIAVSVIKHNKMARFSISDKGNGIPVEFQNKIFTKFSQADSSTSRKQAGTGLGLYISKKLVEDQGGILDYETQIGHGTTFYFDMPLFSSTQT
ncbi:MAG: cell wall metabolism sensor histidine kinase WalK [Gammaproteobacteria bacterium]|nr:cell wall metabolism sensor histidine kinase WalK [Gammaproteobacteria bacterium]